jgi:hypothetical protein
LIEVESNTPDLEFHIRKMRSLEGCSLRAIVIGICRPAGSQSLTQKTTIGRGSSWPDCAILWSKVR